MSERVEVDHGGNAGVAAGDTGQFDPLRPSELRAALARLHFAPNRRLGQNFLIDRNVRDHMIKVAGLGPGDGVLEIGAGAGALTTGLAKAAGAVTCVEADRRLEPLLRSVLQGFDNVRLVFDDALKLDWRGLRSGRLVWKFVANVPYVITAPLLARALEATPRFDLIVLMVQREVARRLCASPGNRTYGALSVLARYYAEVRPVFEVSPHSFWPRPRVWSTVVAIKPRAPASTPSPGVFFAVVRAAFGRRRKQLRNALREDPHLGLAADEVAAVLARAGIDGMRRAETMSLDEFALLARAVRDLRG